MLESLILAYRYQFFRVNLQKAIAFCRENKLLLIGTLFFLISIIAFTIWTIIISSSILQFIALLIELIGVYVVDRTMVKRYQYYLSQRQGHLENVVSFLQTVVPNTDLFNGPQVEELITRLTERIELGAPFKKLKEVVMGFGKSVILPFATFIAGLYTNDLQKMEPVVVVSYAIGVAMLVGILYVLIKLFLELLKKLAFRDYDAAVAFRNDLLDIKFLSFTK